MVLSEGKASLKNPVTPPGIEPRTVRLVAQHFNHYATSRPTVIKYRVQITKYFVADSQIIVFLLQNAVSFEPYN